MTNNQRAMYSALVACRNTEVIQRWSRSQFFLIIHSAGFSFLATRTKPDFQTLLMMGFGGIILGIFWFLANWRTDQWIIYWQSCLNAFEQSEPEPVETPVFSGLAYDRMSEAFLTFNRIVVALTTFFIILWGCVVVYAFFV